MRKMAARHLRRSAALAAAAALGITLSPGRALAQRPLGTDVSHYQATINWASVKSAGVAFAWAKATEGVGYTDAYFAAN